MGNAPSASGRLSSSRPATKNSSSQGFDTISLHWPKQGGTKLLSALGEAETLPTIAGGMLLVNELPGGIRVAAWPDHGSVKVEGRLCALLDQDAGSYRLCSRDELRQADVAARDQLRELLGAAPEGELVGVGRYDLTFEHLFRDGDDGRDLIRAMASLLPPAGYDRRDYTRDDGTITSVAYQTRRGRVITFRMYDKVVEMMSKGVPTDELPGTRIRLEAQSRAKSGARQLPAVLAGRDLRHDFGRMLAPVLQAGHDVTVRGTGAIVDELLARVHRGDLTMAVATRLIGDVEVLRRYGRAAYGDDRLARDRILALRKAGVPLDSTLPPDRTVPVGELLRQAVEEFAA